MNTGQRALDILSVLNGLDEDLDIGSLRFGVATGWIGEHGNLLTPTSPSHPWILLPSGVWYHSSYEYGEVLVLKPNGDEWLGDERRPCKSSVMIEEFDEFADACAVRNKILNALPAPPQHAR